MPNWVFNHLSIEGEAKDIATVKAQLNKPFKSYWKNDTENKVEESTYNNPVFAFWNIIAPPADKYDEYFGTHGYKDGEAQGQTKFNWYNWNNANWGTKWDVAVPDKESYSETELLEESDTTLHYKFDTAWSPPLPVIEALSVQYPQLQITLSYEEEQGWGGEIFWDETGSTIVEEYDIPESHADYEARDREDSCNCANSEDKDDWYDDCPGKVIKPIELHEVRDVELASAE